MRAKLFILSSLLFVNYVRKLKFMITHLTYVVFCSSLDGWELFMTCPKMQGDLKHVCKYRFVVPTLRNAKRDLWKHTSQTYQPKSQWIHSNFSIAQANIIRETFVHQSPLIRALQTAGVGQGYNLSIGELPSHLTSCISPPLYSARYTRTCLSNYA